VDSRRHSAVWQTRGRAAGSRTSQLTRPSGQTTIPVHSLPTLKGGIRLADKAPAAPEVRPIVPYLTLGETRDKDYLNGSRCKNCNTTYVGPRMYCSKCSSQGPFEPIKLSDHGEVHVFTIIHQATPYVQAPYIAAIVDLPEGVSVNTNIVNLEPKPENVKFGMKVKMFTEKVSEDREGNSYIAYRFQPA